MTLILSRCRYLEVMDAFLDGIDLARATGQDLSRIAAVASIFGSRVDTEIDPAPRRDRPGRGESPARHGRDRQRPAGLSGSRGHGGAFANCSIAYDDTLHKLERDGPDDVPDVLGCAHRHP